MQQNKIWENTLVSAEGNLQRYFFLFLPELFITFAWQKNVTYRVKIQAAQNEMCTYMDPSPLKLKD